MVGISKFYLSKSDSQESEKSGSAYSVEAVQEHAGISKFDLASLASSHEEFKTVVEQLVQQNKNAELEKEGIVYFGELSKSVDELKADVVKIVKEDTRDNQSCLRENLKYVVKAKHDDSLECSLAKLATHKIITESRREFFLLDPFKVVIYGGDFSPLCKALKKVMVENYLFLNIDESGSVFSVSNVFGNTNIRNGDVLLLSSKLDVFLNGLKDFIGKGYTIAVDFQHYDPEKHSLLKKFVEEHKETFIVSK